MVTYQTDRRFVARPHDRRGGHDPGVVMCGAEQRLPVVAATMASHAIHTVVVPSAHGGQPLAITDLDLLHAELGGRLGETAGDIARDPMAAVAPSASLEHAIATMATLDVAHLLVCDAESDCPRACSRASTSPPCSAAAIPD